MSRFPFIPLVNGYSVQESVSASNAVDIEGGFSYSVLDYNDVSWTVSCVFVLRKDEYAQFNDWYQEYITPVFPHEFPVMLVTLVDHKDYVFTNHMAHIVPDSISVSVLARHLYEVSLQFEAYQQDEWMVSSVYPTFTFLDPSDAMSFESSILSGEMITYTETFIDDDAFPSESMEFSASIVSGDMITYSDGTYDDYPIESMEFSASLISGDMTTYTETDLPDSAYPTELMAFSASVISGSITTYTERFYEHYQPEAIEFGAIIISGSLT